MKGSGWSDFDADRTPETPPPPGEAAWPRISDYWPDNRARGAETGRPADEVNSGVRYPFRRGADGRGPRDEGAPEAAGPAFRNDDTLAYNQIYPTSLDDAGVPAEPGVRGPATYENGVEEPAPTRLISPPPPPRRPRLRMAATAAGAAVFLGLSAVGLVRVVSTGNDDIAATATSPGGGVVADEPNPPVSVSPSAQPSASPSAGPSASPSAKPTVAARTGPAFAAGTFVLADDVTEVNLTLGRPAGGPVRVSTPPDSGLTTRSAITGTTVTLTAKPSGRPGPGRVDVQLDQRIAWTIRMTGGVKTGTFALAGGTVRGLDLAGGADTIDLALPRTTGALPIRMSGGVHTWRIRTEREEPVRVEVRDGAGAVTLYGKESGGVAKGKEVSAGSGTGLEIDAVAGIGSLTVSAG